MQLILILLALIAPSCISVPDWKPIVPQGLFNGYKGQLQLAEETYATNLHSILAQNYQQPNQARSEGGECSIYKVAFTQDLYFQYIQYKLNLPELKEFTLCHWSKFANHSNDHPIYSYAVDGQPRAIYAWIANTDRSSYFSLAVQGQTLYRLNYPLRLNRWYHTCQSWNGRTGEWQIWVNGERVGRGFHNRLIGQKVPPGGISVTGQEQTQPGGGFLEGPGAPKGSGGMLGEVTMVQLYKVALTAGKAHRNHKHHHAHTFDHNGIPITTTPRPATPPRPMTQTHPLITGGQLNPNIALSIASGQPQPPPQQLVAQPLQGFEQQFVNDPYGGGLILQQMNVPQSRGPQIFAAQPPANRATPQPTTAFGLPQDDLSILLQQNAQQAPLGQPNAQPLINSGLVHSTLVNPANVRFIDTTLQGHKIFKRDNKNSTKNEDKKKYVSTEKTLLTKTTDKQKADIDPLEEESKKPVGKTPNKRELFLQDGSLINSDSGSNTNLFDGALLNSLGGLEPTQPGLNSFELNVPGLNSFGLNQPGLDGLAQNQPAQQQKESETDDLEPAEFEVRTIMNICTGCEPEPFAKALVFGWRGVTKKLYSGTFYTPAIPQCKAF